MKILIVSIVSEDVPTLSILGLAEHALALTRALAGRGLEVDFIVTAKHQLCAESFGQTTLEGSMLGQPTYAVAKSGIPESRASQVYLGQLCLYDSLQELVPGMPRDVRQLQAVTGSCIKRNVNDAITELLEVYRVAPSAVLQGETLCA